MTDWLLLGLAVGLSLWAKYFVAVLAIPLALFVLFDRDARKTLATPGPYIAIAAALVTMAPHLVWLVQNDFLPFAYAEHRALPSRGLIDHVWHPLQFAVSQLFFLLPSLLIAAPLFYPRAAARRAAGRAERRRLRPPHRHTARLRTDGDGAGAVRRQRPRHRGDVGLSALAVPRPVDRARPRAARSTADPLGARCCRPGRSYLPAWASPSSPITRCCRISITATARCSSPAATSAAKSRNAIAPSTGKPLVYVIGTMWDGGNVEHYAPSHPRVLIDGKPARAPWIDLGDLQRARRGGGVDRRRSARHSAGVPDDRRRRRGAAAVPAARPARRQSSPMSAGRSCCRSRLTRRGSSAAPLTRRCCRRDDGAVEQLDLAVHALGQREIVGDRHHGLAVLVDQFAQHLEHLLAGVRIERAGRLVGENDRRLVGERARHRHALALAAGELVGRLCT